MDGVNITARIGDHPLPALARVLELALKHPGATVDDDGTDLLAAAMAAHPEPVNVYAAGPAAAPVAAEVEAVLAGCDGVTVEQGPPPLTAAQTYGWTPEQIAQANAQRHEPAS